MSPALSLMLVALGAAGAPDADKESETEAAAVVVKDPACRFELTLDDLDADICVVHPPALRDPRTCEAMGVDVSKIPVAPATVASAMLRYEEGTTYVQIFKTEWHQPFSEREMRDLIAASVEAAQKRVGMDPKARGLGEGAAFDTFPLGGQKLLRYVLELPKKPDSGLDRFLNYAFRSSDCLIQLSFATDEEQLETVADLADDLVLGAEVSSPKSDAENLGYRIGYILGFSCCIGSFVAAGLVAFYLLYRAAKKNPPPAAGPLKAAPEAKPVEPPPAGGTPAASGGGAPPPDGKPPPAGGTG